MALQTWLGHSDMFFEYFGELFRGNFQKMIVLLDLLVESLLVVDQMILNVG